MNDFVQNAENLYESFDEVLAEADCEITASEFQGILVGMICAGLEPANGGWEKELVSAANDGQTLSVDAKSAADSVALESQRALIEQDELAPILIPDSDYPMIDRLESVSLWCQGFLLGFGLQIGDSLAKKAEIQESLQDISEISMMKLSQEDDEASQNDLLVVIEHVKVAVQLIYLELVVKLQTMKVNVSGSETYH